MTQQCHIPDGVCEGVRESVFLFRLTALIEHVLFLPRLHWCCLTVYRLHCMKIPKEIFKKWAACCGLALQTLEQENDGKQILRSYYQTEETKSEFRRFCWLDSFILNYTAAFFRAYLRSCNTSAGIYVSLLDVILAHEAWGSLVFAMSVFGS